MADQFVEIENDNMKNFVDHFIGMITDMVKSEEIDFALLFEKWNDFTGAQDDFEEELRIELDKRNL